MSGNMLKKSPNIFSAQTDKERYRQAAVKNGVTECYHEELKKTVCKMLTAGEHYSDRSHEESVGVCKTFYKIN